MLGCVQTHCNYVLNRFGIFMWIQLSMFFIIFGIEELTMDPVNGCVILVVQY